MAEPPPPPAILVTQCLQNDFVKPIGRFDPLPNRLHIGFREARRLMGEEPDEGPVSRMMEWASQMPAEELAIIHILDWHDESDPIQASHLHRFGRHCLASSDGAELAFAEPGGANTPLAVVKSRTLNDFLDTRLGLLLAPWQDAAPRIGIIGVWTEAKVTFLAYELRTRFPAARICVCSALTASSSRSQHFVALDQLERVLGVQVVDAVGDFMEMLGGSAQSFDPTGIGERHPLLSGGEGLVLSEGDNRLLRYLFRDCKEVQLRVLDGGFSGNLVLGTESTDLYGHRQAPHVVKIGPRDLIGQERTAFERIEEVLGNCAPRVSDFADLGERGAISYRYASMAGDFATSTTTFQKMYMAGAAHDEVERVLHTVFVEQLGRLYLAARRETMDLLEYYEFSTRWGPGVRRRVRALLGAAAVGDTLQLECGGPFYNLCRFYESDLEHLPRLRGDTAHVAFVHGDLNGANIVVDGNRNVWLIDFFHTHRGHVLRDLIKLENDLLYLFTPLAGLDELEQAMALTDLLLEVEDLAAGVPAVEERGITAPQLLRAHDTVACLRSFYPDLVREDRDPLQLWIGQLRYAAHTLGFDEASPMQRRWALYTASRCAELVVNSLAARGPLRVDRLQVELTAPGRLGITICPGRRDLGRDLDVDLDTLRQEGISHVVCLLPRDDLARVGVPDLLERYRAAGIQVYHLPIVDQQVCSHQAMAAAVAWIGTSLEQGAEVLVHCLGGLGRSGTVAACLLKQRGCSAAEAVAEVRRVRTRRAIETAVQVGQVYAFSSQ